MMYLVSNNPRAQRNLFKKTATFEAYDASRVSRRNWSLVATQVRSGSKGEK